MKTAQFILWPLSIIIAVNIVSLIMNSDNCSYSNYCGSFTFKEENFKQRNFQMCERKFSEFRKQEIRDTIMYRLCKKNYLKFWEWGNYLWQRKFQLPYMSWSEIELRRGAIDTKSGFQDF